MLEWIYPPNRIQALLASAAGEESWEPDYTTLEAPRIELYLRKINGEDVQLPEYPVTTIEKFLAYKCGEDVELPEPVTRLEMLLAKDTPVEPAELPEPQTMIEYYVLNMQAGGGVELTVSGNAPVTLANAIAHAIVSLTQEGQVTQASTPTPSAPVPIVCNNGTLKLVDEDLPTGYARVLGYQCNNNAMWEITDFHLQGADTVRISFSVNAACNVFGCYQGADATDNYDLYASVSSGAKYFRYADGTYLSYFAADAIGQRFDVVYTPNGSRGMPQDSTWSPATFTAANNLLLGSTTTTGTSSKLNGNLYGDFIVEQNGVERLHLIPCMRASDTVLGYYDTVGATFYEPYEGFDGAVSLGWDTSHYSLQTVGIPEALSVLPCVAEGYATLPYVAMDGAQKLATSVTGIGSRVEIIAQNTADNNDSRGLVTYDSNYGGMHVYAKDGDDYALASTAKINGTAHNKNLVKVLFDTGSSSYNRATLTIGDQTVTYTRTTARPTKNLSFFGALSTTAEAWVGKCWGIKIYTDSTNTLVYDGVPCIRLSDGKVGFYDTVSETFTASSGSSDFIAGYETTVSVENLYSCGSTKDEQDIIHGTVTRNCQVYVVTGQEGWLKNTTYSGTFYADDAPADAILTETCVCTHYKGMKGNTSVSAMTNNTTKVGTSSYKTRIYIKDTAYTSADDFKAFLAEQYALGTPVIIVYPLATETTEQVTAQPLRTAEGTNTVSVTSNVDPVTLTVVYKGTENGGSIGGDDDPGEVPFD